MKYNQLKVTTKRPRRRVGRGISAGQGKTAGRGTKGQGARKSGGVRLGFEGGQMPLYMRLPKLRGFKSHRPGVEVVYTGQLEELNKVITNQALFEAGLVASPYSKVKLIAKGDLKGAKEVRLQAASATAQAAIKAAGGSFSLIKRQGRPAKKG